MTTPPVRPRIAEELARGEVIALEPVTLTREMVVGYAREFDPLPFHLDESAARRSLLGGLAASGWQTALFAHKRLIEALPAGLDARLVSIVDLKWKRPVLVGDTISGTATIDDIAPAEGNAARNTLTVGVEMRNQRGEPVLTVTCRYALGGVGSANGGAAA